MSSGLSLDDDKNKSSGLGDSRRARVAVSRVPRCREALRMLARSRLHFAVAFHHLPD